MSTPAEADGAKPPTLSVREPGEAGDTELEAEEEPMGSACETDEQG
ncbi:hypothetical protein [Natronorubrum sp. DTA7]